MKLLQVGIPAVIKMPFKNNNIFSSSVYAGFEPGLYLSGKRSGNYLITSDDPDISGDYSSSIGNLKDYYCYFITGFDFPFTFHGQHYALDFRYKRSITDSFENVVNIEEIPADDYPYIDKNGNAIDLRLNSLNILITRFF